jgi:hypothetical protein
MRGMKRAAEGIERGAEEVLRTTAASVDDSPAVVNQVRSMAEISRSNGPREFEDSFLDIKRHHYGYRANVGAARVDNSRFEDLLDMVVGRPSDDGVRRSDSEI